MGRGGTVGRRAGCAAARAGNTGDGDPHVVCRTSSSTLLFFSISANAVAPSGVILLSYRNSRLHALMASSSGPEIEVVFGSSIAAISFAMSSFTSFSPSCRHGRGWATHKERGL